MTIWVRTQVSGGLQGGVQWRSFSARYLMLTPYPAAESFPDHSRSVHSSPSHTHTLPVPLNHGAHQRCFKPIYPVVHTTISSCTGAAPTPRCSLLFYSHHTVHCTSSRSGVAKTSNNRRTGRDFKIVFLIVFNHQWFINELISLLGLRLKGIKNVYSTVKKGFTVG